MILCCGEALIDMIPARTDQGRPAYAPHTGGAVFNTAIALGRLGVPTGMLTGLSTDLHGRMLEGDLARAGVDTALSVRSDRPTTLAFVELSEGEARYTFYDENSAGRLLRRQDIGDLPARVSALFCGGISLVFEPAADAYAALAEHQAGRLPIMVDPNIRPGFIADEPAYRARLARVIAASDILKISDADLDWLDPAPGSVADKIARLCGPSLAVVTRGGRGATGFLADGSVVEVPALPVEVVDTVGAGDAFNAGLLAQLHRDGALSASALAQLGRADLERALVFAHKVAARTVARPGADPPWAAEIEAG